MKKEITNMTMRSLIPLSVVAAILWPAAAQKVSSVPVTAVIHDEDNAVPPNQYLLRSDDYDGIRQATYQDTSLSLGKNQPTIQNIIYLAGGQWQFSLRNQTVRKLWLTLGSQGAPVPDGYYTDVTLDVSCWVNGTNTGLLVIPPGSSNYSWSMQVKFVSGGATYWLQMGPGQPAPAGLVTVSCAGADSGGACNAWTITPTPDITIDGSLRTATTALLYKSVKTGTAYAGTYRNSFRIEITKP